MTKIAIIGYGKMGREIHKLATGQDWEVTAIIDNADDWRKKEADLNRAQVAIEFTSPEVVLGNLEKLIQANIPVVTGTTGWHEKLPAIEALVKECNGSLLHASNFSIGVNLFFALNTYLAKLMSTYPQYRIELEETHHTQKLDAPSGTAVAMLKDILKQHEHYADWRFLHENPGQKDIPVTCHRMEDVKGTHKVIYQSAIDDITIEHKAHSREGFARGALMAARWLPGKKGVFTMKSLLENL